MGWRGASRKGEAMGNLVAAIPAFNEEVAIGTVVLKCLQHVDEVVVVDDGSDDGTSRVASLARAKVLRHHTNRGKGTAVRTAFDYARKGNCRALILVDGDGQHNPDEIPRVLEPILTGRADMVCGLRLADTSGAPLYRRFGQRILDYATGVGAGGLVTDSQCGFRAFSRRAIEALDLQEDDFAVDSEMVIRAREAGLTIAEVPIHCRYDVDGSTKAPLRHGLQVIDRVLRIVGHRHPLMFFGLFGAGLLFLATYLGIRILDVYEGTGVFATGYAFLVSILLSMGMMSLFTGVILNVVGNAVRGRSKEALGEADR